MMQRDLVSLLSELRHVEQALEATTDRATAAVLIRRKENLVSEIGAADRREFPRKNRELQFGEEQ